MIRNLLFTIADCLEPRRALTGTGSDVAGGGVHVRADAVLSTVQRDGILTAAAPRSLTRTARLTARLPLAPFTPASVHCKRDISQHRHVCAMFLFFVFRSGINLELKRAQFFEETIIYVMQKTCDKVSKNLHHLLCESSISKTKTPCFIAKQLSPRHPFSHVKPETSSITSRPENF